MEDRQSLTLFTPVQLGQASLKHRIVMAPLTRSRSIRPDSIPGDLMKDYYQQRASDGGLIITEATNISLTSRGWLGAPGLYSDQQVQGWKQIVTAVQAKGGLMFAQLWHTGRSSHTAMTGEPFLSPHRSTRNTGSIPTTSYRSPAAGFSRLLTGPYPSRKLARLCRITAG